MARRAGAAKRKTLNQRTWARREDDYELTYEEWISIANYHPDQNLVWRTHELHARVANDGKPIYQSRMQVETDRPWDLSELGGEG